MNIEERLYPQEFKPYLLNVPWLKGMKYFPEQITEMDNFYSPEAPVLMGGEEDENGEYIIPEIWIPSEDYEFLVDVTNYFMERNGGVPDFTIDKSPQNGLSFIAENELFLVKIEFFEQHNKYLLTIGYYGNYGRHDKLFEGEENIEFGICSKSEYFTKIIPGIRCVYGSGERSNGGPFFLAQEKEDLYHISAFSEDFNHLFLKHLRVVTGLDPEVFDIDLNEVYPGISNLEESLSQSALSSFYFSSKECNVSLSIGINLWRLDIEIYKTERKRETFENEFVASYINALVWMLIINKDLKRAQALLPINLGMSENKNSLDTAAVLHLEIKEYETALEYANKSVNLDETIADHFLTRAKIHIAMNSLDLAKNDLLKTLEINPYSKVTKELLETLSEH